MKRLYEDKRPSKLYVRFSEQINQNINLIWANNQSNTEALSQWFDYIEGIKRWLSNPSIAWDYVNRFAKFPNGSRYIQDFNYNIGYTVKTNQYGAYVYVFMINLKPQEFGLKTIRENKIFNNTMKTNKKVIRLTEADLHCLIEEAVKGALNEIGDTFRGQYMIGRAAGKAKSRGDVNVAANIFNKAKKQRGQCISKMDAFDKEGAYRQGYNDESTPKDKSVIRRNYKTYQSWDNDD